MARVTNAGFPFSGRPFRPLPPPGPANPDVDRDLTYARHTSAILSACQVTAASPPLYGQARRRPRSATRKSSAGGLTLGNVNPMESVAIISSRSTAVGLTVQLRSA